MNEIEKLKNPNRDKTFTIDENTKVSVGNEIL